MTKDRIWVTAQGQRISLEQMDDNHLLNTIAWLQRKIAEQNLLHEEARELDEVLPAYTINGDTLETWLRRLKKEAYRRGRRQLSAARKVLNTLTRK